MYRDVLNKQDVPPHSPDDFSDILPLIHIELTADVGL